MDISKSKKNIVFAIGFKVILLALGVLTTRCLIKCTGNEINGVNFLFTSIIGFLNIAELGVGTAISYCMYKPIVDGDDNTVATLYKLFKRIYIIIGMVIFGIGLFIIPFLPYLAKGYSANVNISSTFFLMLISVVVSYFYSSKSSLINAYKNNYVATTVTSLGMIIQQLLQIVVLICFSSFVLFIICRIVAGIFQWIVFSIIVNKNYSNITYNKSSGLSAELKKDISSNVRAMFFHKVGGVLVNSIDSIVISSFCGVALLGKYSNYVSIMTSMVGVLILFFIPLTSTIGHFYAKGDKGVLEKYFGFFRGINFVVGSIFFLGYYAVIDDVVSLFYGQGLLLSKAVVYVITINYFIQFMRQAVLLFRDATGTFYYDRWKPLIEGITNLVLSIAFVYLFPEEYKLVGVLIATIITNLCICHIVEPYILHKYVFKSNAIGYCIENYLFVLLFGIGIFMVEKLKYSTNVVAISIVANGIIAVVVGCVSIPLCLILIPNFKSYSKRVLCKVLENKRVEGRD